MPPSICQWVRARIAGTQRLLACVAPPAIDQPLTQADKVLRQLAFAAEGPISRAEIARNEAWEFSVTSTLTGSLQRATRGPTPWLVKVPNTHGVYEMAPKVRQHIAAEPAARA